MFVSTYYLSTYLLYLPLPLPTEPSSHLYCILFLKNWLLLFKPISLYHTQLYLFFWFSPSFSHCLFLLFLTFPYWLIIYKPLFFIHYFLLLFQHPCFLSSFLLYLYPSHPPVFLPPILLLLSFCWLPFYFFLPALTLSFSFSCIPPYWLPLLKVYTYLTIICITAYLPIQLSTIYLCLYFCLCFPDSYFYNLSPATQLFQVFCRKMVPTFSLLYSLPFFSCLPYWLILYFKIFIYFWLCWVFVSACRLSLFAADRAYSLFVVGRLLIAEPHSRAGELQ